MSTRVQKGGTVFRPVARPRARPGSESRQASAAPDARHSVDPSGTHSDSAPSIRAASVMPPPSSVPYKSMSVAAQPLLGSFTSQPAQGDNSRSGLPVLNTVLPDDQENVEHFSDAGTSNITLPVRERSRPPPVQIHPPHVSGAPLRQVAPNVESVMDRGAAIPVIAGQFRGVPTATTSSRTTATSSAAGVESASLVQPQQVPVQPHSVTDIMNTGQHGPNLIEMSQIDPSLIESSASYPQAYPPDQNISQALTQDGIYGPLFAGHGSWNESDPAGGSTGDPQASGLRHKRRRTQPAADLELFTGTTPAGAEADVVKSPPKRKRSRRTSRDGTESEGGDGSQVSTRKRKPRDPNAPRKSRKRAPSVAPFEPSADPGEELDPTVITMSALCDDTGQGRISSKAAQIMTNHTAWRAANKEKRARLKAIMEAKKYGRNLEDEDQPSNRSGQDVANSGENATVSTSAAAASADPPVAGPSTARDGRPIDELQRRDDFNYNEDMATSRYNVQVRIGANGETIIDEESLFVNRNEEDDTENYTHVEESDTTKFVNSLSYSKKTRGSRWSAEETELFYDALSQFGENYELISYVLPGRDRKACKNKFKAEDKKDPNRINYCLNNRRPFDIATLSRMTGKDFSGPTPIIKAPTPLRSTQLDATLQSEDDSFPDMTRKRSKTPGLGDDGEEILGSVDDVEKEGSVFGDTDDT